MKNKRLLYVLLPAVLAIWGLIFQRLWSAAEGGPEEAVMETVEPRPTARPVTSHAPPKLLLNYGDPFKGSTIKLSQSVDMTGPSSNPVPAVGSSQTPSLNFPVAAPAIPAPPVVWPSLKYLGSINNTRQDTQIALLVIEDKETMLKAGDNRQGVMLTKIFRDSVQVVFKGKKKAIIRNLSSQ